MVIAHRHRYASFTTPKRVPLEPVEIDWNHPLANALVSCYIPGGPSGLSDVTRLGAALTASTAASAASLKAGPLGPGLGQLAASSEIYGVASSAQRIANTSPGASVFWLGQQLSNPNGNILIAGVAANNTNSSPYFSYTIWQGTTGALIAGCSSNNGTTPQTPAPTAPSVFSAAATFAVGGNCNIYANGILGGTPVSIGASPFSYAASAAPCIGCTPGVSARYPSTTTNLVLFYARPLSANEIAWLNNEPFAMLRPVQRKIRALVSTSAPAPFRRQMKTYLRR